MNQQTNQSQGKALIKRAFSGIIQTYCLTKDGSKKAYRYEGSKTCQESMSSGRFHRMQVTGHALAE